MSSKAVMTRTVSSEIELNMYENRDAKESSTGGKSDADDGRDDWYNGYREQDRPRLAGGRVTRFPFGPLNVFVYISHWAVRVNSQNRPHF